MSVWCVVTLFACGRTPRPGAAFRLAHALPEGECDHAHPPHFGFQPRASGKVGPEHSLSQFCREATLTTGLSLLWSLWSPTHRAALTRGVTRVMQLQAASRTCLLQTAPALCLLRCSAHALETEQLTLKAMWWGQGKAKLPSLKTSVPQSLNFHPFCGSLKAQRFQRGPRACPPRHLSCPCVKIKTCTALQLVELVGWTEVRRRGTSRLRGHTGESNNSPPLNCVDRGAWKNAC